MKELALIIVTISAAVAFVGCGAGPSTGNIGTANTATPAAAATPSTLAALKELETKAFEAFKNKDGKFYEAFLTDKTITSEGSKRYDKPSIVKMIADNPCDIKSYAFSDEKLTHIGADTALITMKVIVDGICAGNKMPSPYISASLYVRNGAEWKAAWHGEANVVDPTAPPAPPVPDNGPPGSKPAVSDDRSPETAALAAIERSVWEGWMTRDGKKLAELTAPELAFVNIFGGYYPNREETLKNWTENPCQITRVDVANTLSIAVTNDTSLFFHKGTAEGTCFGKKVGPVYRNSIYVKDGNAWKLAFTMNLPPS